MKTNKNTSTAYKSIIGETNHRDFLEFQVAYGFAKRGGSQLQYASESNHPKRVVSNVNLLNKKEIKNLIFNENIFSN